MYRIALDYIHNWRFKASRKPLIIRGARQVGKSYLVRQFARSESLNLVEINFEKEPDAAELFQSQSISKICELLELQYRTRIDLRTTVLFLDEIQSAPKVIPVLRYFYEEKPELCIIAAGSLLEFTLEDHSFSMPVGRVEYLHLGPMTFEEFLLASEDKDLCEFIMKFQLKDSIPSPIHKKLLEKVKIFCVVGGMPEAIGAFITGSWNECEPVKRNILSTYEDDFSKYRQKVSDIRMRKVFQKMPRLIGEKVKYVNIDPLEKARDLSRALDLLCMARVGHRVYHSAANGIPLGAEIDEKFFKLIFLDIGLVSSACSLGLLDIEREKDINLVNQGKLTEQLIGQHLLYNNQVPYQPPELFYWARERKNASAEVDFLVSVGSEIIPIEVKSGKTGRLRSLHIFLEEKKHSMAVRFNSEPPNIFKENKTCLLSLPFYLVGQWKRLLLSI